MKINTTIKPSKILIIFMSILAVIALGYFAVAYASNIFPFNNDQTQPSSQDQSSKGGVNYEATTSDQKDAGEVQKKTTAPVDSNEAGDGNESASLTVTITALSQNGDLVQVRGLINKVSTSGTCKLSLTKGGEVVIRESEMQALPKESTCMGFDIPVSDLSPGVWTAKLNAQIGTAVGSTTKTITVK